MKLSGNLEQEALAAEHAVALGAPLVIPHHYRAYGELPAADLDLFAHTLQRLAPETRLQVIDVMGEIAL